ncbi:hypothetical protein K502DRAFT_355523 [Neoconidiobolus thromboides FSU 785]|nr:hypothetical protein K502DRAFT_355523 [Neoconidiobolus thromboides FSU 785]
MKFINVASLFSLSATVLTATLPADQALAQPINQATLAQPINQATLAQPKGASGASYNVGNPYGSTELDERIRNYFRYSMMNRYKDPRFYDYLNISPESNKKPSDILSYVGKKLILKGGYPSYGGYNSINEADLPQPNRIITPDTFGVTMDYVQNRLNVVVDKDYIITKTYYG